MQTCMMLHCWKENVVTIEDTISKSKKVITLNAKINAEADSIVCNRRIFIIGGSGPIADSYEVDLQSNTLVSKASMLCKKYAHSLCTSDSSIYSVGGYNATVEIADCEKYDIINNIWVSLPNLNIARYWAAAFIMNRSYMYAFAGHEKVQINSLESLNLNGMVKWEMIAVTNACSPRYGIHGIQIKADEALVFGGCTSENTSECYILKMCGENVSSLKVSNLSVVNRFYYSSAPIFDGKSVYGGSNDKKIHIYSLETQKWGIK